MAGLAPQSAGEVNHDVGTILRGFVDNKESVSHLRESLAGVDLKAEPYLMSVADETLIKSAINDLDTALDGINMVWINQLVGLW